MKKKWNSIIKTKRKYCYNKTCKEVNPQSIENFDKNKTLNTGLAGWCKKCTQKYRKKNKDIFRQSKMGGGRYSCIKSSVKCRTKKLEFKLTKEEYYKIISNVCFYCSFSLNDYGLAMDRIDNSKGYTIDNVVPCCTECNIARNDNFSHTEMLLIGKVIKKIKENRNAENNKS